VFYVLFGILLELLCWSVVLSGVFVCEVGYSRSVAAKAQIAILNLAVHLYKDDVGSFPSEAQGLKALREDLGVAGWKGPYLRQGVPLDPWGRPYIYRSEGVPEILTLGSDGKSGGLGYDQDISSLRPDEMILPSWQERFGRSALFWSAVACGVGYPFLPWMLRRFRAYRSARSRVAVP
jgi:general secretion pathway protein G